jgi:hypothetical protein
MQFYKVGSELVPVGTNQFALLSPHLVVIENKPPAKVDAKIDNKKKKKKKSK